MKIKPIYKSSDASEIAAVRNLYEEAFPREERIDWNDLMRLAIVMPLSIDAYYIDDKFIGFTILNERNDFNWFWYFVIKALQLPISCLRFISHHSFELFIGSVCKNRFLHHLLHNGKSS